MLANEQKDGIDGRYGPWVVVTRKKNGTKSQRSGGVTMVQGSGQPQQLQKRSESGLRTNFATRQIEPRSEAARETKCKLNGPVVDSVIQRIVKEPNQWAQGRLESNQKLKELDQDSIQFDMDLSKPNPSHKHSVKGKKALARLRTSQTKVESAVGAAFTDCTQVLIISQEINFHDASASCSKYGGQQTGCADQFQFTTGQHSKVGHSLRERGSSDFRDGKLVSGREMDLQRAQEAMDLEVSSDESECIGGRDSFVGPIVGYGGNPMESLEKQSHFIGNSSALIDKCA